MIVGSVLTMNRAFGNLVTTVGLDPCLSARFCATNAARLLGRGQEQGRIEPEMRADLAVLNAEFECVATFVQGRLAYKAGERFTAMEEPQGAGPVNGRIEESSRQDADMR